MCGYESLSSDQLFDRVSRSDHERAATTRSGGAPCNRHLGIDVDAVSGFERLVHSTGIELQLAFEYVDHGCRQAGQPP